MTYGDQAAASSHELALIVGCDFEVETAVPLDAVLQVAPCPQPGVQIQRERWDSGCDHHGYIDHYENRCERFAIASGSSRIAYEAEVLLTDPADVIEPEAPVASLPDEALSFVMPSGSCLPDEL
jgi:hypothetical protein